MVSDQPNTTRCVDCGVEFDDPEELRQHRQAANHPGLDMDAKVECQTCGFVLETEEDLRKHVQMTHAGSQ